METKTLSIAKWRASQVSGATDASKKRKRGEKTCADGRGVNLLDESWRLDEAASRPAHSTTVAILDRESRVWVLRVGVD